MAATCFTASNYAHTTAGRAHVSGGYALAKFRFRGRYLVFIAILSTLMIPTEMLVIPWYLMASKFGWLDTYWGIMFPGMMTAFGVFLMKQFFETVPDEPWQRPSHPRSTRGHFSARLALTSSTRLCTSRRR